MPIHSETPPDWYDPYVQASTRYIETEDAREERRCIAIPAPPRRSVYIEASCAEIRFKLVGNPSFAVLQTKVSFCVKNLKLKVLVHELVSVAGTALTRYFETEDARKKRRCIAFSSLPLRNVYIKEFDHVPRFVSN